MKGKFVIVVMLSLVLLAGCTPKNADTQEKVTSLAAQAATQTGAADNENPLRASSGTSSTVKTIETPGVVTTHAIRSWWAIPEGVEEYFLIENSTFVKCRSMKVKNDWVGNLRMDIFTYELVDGRKGETKEAVFRKIYQQGEVIYGVVWEVVYAERNPTQPCQMQSLCKVVKGTIVEKLSDNEYNGKTFKLMKFMKFGLDSLEKPTKLIAQIEHVYGLMGSDGGSSSLIYEIDLLKNKLESQPLCMNYSSGWSSFQNLALLDGNDNPVSVVFYFPFEGEKTVRLAYDISGKNTQSVHLYNPETASDQAVVTYPVEQLHIMGGTRVFLDPEAKTSRILQDDVQVEYVPFVAEPHDPILIRNGKLLFFLYRFKLADGSIVYSDGEGIRIKYELER